MIKGYALIKIVIALARETEEFSLRGVAEKANVSTSTAKACLDYLLKNSLVKMKKIGKSHLFRFEGNFLAKQTRILFSLAEINASGLVSKILGHNKGIISIVLYGSAAKGEDNKKSDIDILIITQKKEKIPELEAGLNREVTILAYSYPEWREKAERDRAFYNEVILNCIPLYGEKPVTQ